MDYKLNDVVSKKKSVLFSIVAMFSVIPFILGRFIENIWIDSAMSGIVTISYFLIYVGIILILFSSVTWKWKKIVDKKSGKSSFIERSPETKEEEFQRRQTFAFGLYISVYGAMIQATYAFFNI